MSLKRAALADLERRARAIDGEARDLRRMSRRLEALRGQVRGKGALPSVLARLNRALPQDVTLLSLVGVLVAYFIARSLF